MVKLAPSRSHSAADHRLVALLCLVGVLGAPREATARQSAPDGRGHRVTWAPELPAQGRLFRVRVAPGAPRSLTGVTGSTAGESLHFRAGPGGGFEAVAPVPIDASGSLDVVLDLSYADGSSERVRAEIPLSEGRYEHERLTVAPRFGSPPSEADQRRRARDAARARAVSEAAHATPRLWTPEVILPRRDRVTSGFGNGRVFNGQVSSRHMGLDLDGEPGDTVYAATRGVVELVDEFLLAGNIVYLNHGEGLVSGYFHLSRQLVAQGDTVSAGTPIGLVGSTGRVTGPHLHWVVRYGYVTVDPRSLLEVLQPGP